MPNQLTIKVWETSNLPPNWSKRIKALNEKDNLALETTVKSVIEAVKKEGDKALIEYTEKFDKTKLTDKTLKVSIQEIKDAYKSVTPEQIAALKLMKEKISAIDSLTLKQQPQKTTREDITVQATLRSIESVGCYVPGGLATYPSTLVMTATPAKVAGVSRIVVCSPPTSQGTISPLILVAADICEVNEIYKVGGVQAIAALAYGTQTIKPVKKIVGPGSKYVTAAKVLVSQEVAIDMPAGPSEVLILADDTAEAKFIAADMISQAEHGTDSTAGLITTSENLANQVRENIEKAVENADRKEIIKQSLSEYGFIIICKSTEEMIMLANEYATEHLEIITKDPMQIAEKITSAGVILVGPYSPVALSDYGSGTNHVLPTGGFGHAFSGLSVLDFTRRVNIVESSKDGLLKVKDAIKVLTEAERLPNHYKAVEERFNQ
jgi:histidinol dehydrogenase